MNRLLRFAYQTGGRAVRAPTKHELPFRSSVWQTTDRGEAKPFRRSKIPAYNPQQQFIHMEKVMKIKNHLFRLTVGFAAFAIGFAWFSVWQHFQTNLENIKEENQLAETTQSDWGNVRQNYNSFIAELDKNSSESIDEIRPIITKDLETLPKVNEGFNPRGRYYFFERT